MIKKIIKKLLSLFQVKKILKTNVYFLKPDERLVGKKVIITGGGRGLGYAMARKFVSEGAQVLITGRKEETLKRVSEEIGCKYLQFDVTQFDQFDVFLDKADDLLKGVNVLVNNAGISLHEGSIYKVSEDQYNQQFDTNLKACYFLTQKFLKRYCDKERENGSVLFLSSERGEYVDDIPYGLIKSAINSLTKGLAKTHIRKNIRINAVAPGITATEMTKRSEDNLYTEKYATGRYYLPDEVAEIACFLVSDASSCLSGQILVCNNAYSVNHYKK